MKKSLAFITAILLASTPAYSQDLFTNAPIIVKPSGGGGGYTGIGDTKAAVHFWSMAAYNAADAAAAAAMFQMCDGAGANCHDIHATSTGGRNATDLAFNSCNTSGTCIVKKIYDRGTSPIDITLCGTPDGCPLYSPNGISTGIPAMVPNSGGPNVTGSVASISPPYSFNIVAATPTPNAGFNARVMNAPDPVGILCCNASHWTLYSSGVYDGTATITANTFYSVYMGTDGTGTGAFVNQNGSENHGGNAGSGAYSGAPGSNFMQNAMKFSQLAIFGSRLTLGEQTSLIAIDHNNWGT